jgi:hypothetical protein
LDEPPHGQHELQPPASLIAQVHAIPPLYVHVHVDPSHVAPQTLPALSVQYDAHIAGSAPAPPLPPELSEHEPSPCAGGRGIAGHTSAGTGDAPPDVVTLDPTTPASTKQFSTASSSGSHDVKAALPPLVQSGSIASVHWMNASARGAHAGAIVANVEQSIGHVDDTAQPACIIRVHVA